MRVDPRLRQIRPRIHFLGNFPGGDEGATRIAGYEESPAKQLETNVFSDNH